MTNPDLLNDVDPDELLRTAASAARRAIPLLMQRLGELEAEIAVTKSKLMRLHQVAAINDEAESEHVSAAVLKAVQNRNRFAHSGVVAVPGVGNNVRFYGGGEAITLVDNESDPQALTDIKRALFENSEPMKVAEISEYIKKMSEREWGSSTIYNHLNKGKASGVFANANNRWSLTEQGQIEMLA